jgi:hypothetical protein
MHYLRMLVMNAVISGPMPDAALIGNGVAKH